MTGVDPGGGTPGCTRKHHGHRPEYPPPTGRGREAVVADMLVMLLRLGTYGLDRSKEADLHAYALACKAALATERDDQRPSEDQTMADRRGRHPVPTESSNAQ